MALTSIALFCGSAWGNHPEYSKVAHDFGKRCADEKITLYYGGACVGLMDVAAKAALANNGKVIGISPTFFTRDVVQPETLTEFIAVKTMSERKQLLEKRADAFVALPGGFGTMDELFEIITDAPLGLHNKPIAVLNTLNYYAPLLEQLAHFQKEGFLKPFHHDLLMVADTIETLFEKIKTYQNPNRSDWLQKVKHKNE